MRLAVTAESMHGPYPTPSDPMTRPPRGPALVFTQKEPCPPRLCPEDLPDPNRYHRRLTEWLLKLR